MIQTSDGFHTNGLRIDVHVARSDTLHNVDVKAATGKSQLGDDFEVLLAAAPIYRYLVYTTAVAPTVVVVITFFAMLSGGMGRQSDTPIAIALGLIAAFSLKPLLAPPGLEELTRVDMLLMLAVTSSLGLLAYWLSTTFERHRRPG